MQDSIESDKKKSDEGISRLTDKHGGKLGELIPPENIQPNYDVNCQHKNKKLERGDFDEVTCEDCPFVWVFEKDTFIV